MTPEDFFEQMKKMFSQQNEGSESSPSTSQNIIAKPRKNYISAHDILGIFGISKDVYNNLLVRTKHLVINNLLVTNLVSFLRQK